MRLSCVKDGEVDRFQMDGYSVASLTKSATNRDLEGITFVVESPEGDELTAQHIGIEDPRKEDYLDKFSNIRQEIAEGITERLYENRLGYLEFLHPDENIQGEYYTLIVDDMFIPNVDGFKGLSGVFGTSAELHLIDDYNDDITPLQFCKTVVKQAEQDGLTSIEFCEISREEFIDPLEQLGFDVDVDNGLISARKELN